MKSNTDLALIPVNREIQPVRSAFNRGVASYTEQQKDNLVRISFPGSKNNRVGTTYGRIGNEKEKKSMGENIDLYV